MARLVGFSTATHRNFTVDFATVIIIVFVYEQRDCSWWVTARFEAVIRVKATTISVCANFNRYSSRVSSATTTLVTTVDVGRVGCTTVLSKGFWGRFAR